MRLQELFENTEDDRVISKLSNVIYRYITDRYQGMNPEEISGPVGTIEEICNLPSGAIGKIFGDIKINLISDGDLKKRDAENSDQEIDPYLQKSTIGAWHPGFQQIDLNTDFLGSNKLKTTIAHELRHALDDMKSGNWANSPGGRYTTPKKKEHRIAKDSNDKTPYLAEPAEINARFMEVQHQLADFIPRIYKKFPPDQIKQKILQYIGRLFQEYRISELFPEKSASRDYKQLMKRVMAFASEEMKDIEKATQKSAQGNW